MEFLKQVKNVIQVLLFPEPSVALNSAPVFFPELSVAELPANAQEDQNVHDLKQVDNWFVIQVDSNLLAPDVVKEDSSQEELAKLTELVQNNLFSLIFTYK